MSALLLHNSYEFSNTARCAVLTAVPRLYRRVNSVKAYARARETAGCPELRPSHMGAIAPAGGSRLPLRLFLVLVLSVHCSHAGLYSPTDDVVQLTADEFEQRVRPKNER
jgi:hypothetical protein